MRGFLALSWAPNRATPLDHDRAERAISYLSSGAATPVVHRGADGWVAITDPDPDDEVDDQTRAFTFRLGRAARTPSGEMSTSALSKLLGNGTAVDGETLTTLLPPFAAAHRSGADEPVVAATDWLGFRQLFWWQGHGVAAISTSALALGVLGGAEFDTAALGLQSLVGWQVGLGTVMKGVTKLAAGSVAVMHAGRVHVRRYVEASLSLDGRSAALPDVVEEMARLLRDFHEAYLADHPDTVLQLTGGQDTRVLLSAVPPARRQGLRALTVDVHGGSDSAFAAKLSRLCELDHLVYWLDDQPPISPQTAHQLALEASAALDCMASPLALAPLLLAESNLEQGHRLSGLGGETARGFYYFGQPRHATTEPRLVNQLARWRLFANEAVTADALTSDFAVSARHDALDLINASFEGTSSEWLRATDQFYLFQRMQRWAGAHGSVAAANRFFINPMFDRRFVQLAHHAAPDDKRGGRLTGMLIARLDPGLAAVPLDSGLVPERLGVQGMRTRAALARVTARKAAGKLRQRLRRAGRPQLGATEMAALVVAHWRSEPDAVAPLRGMDLVREDWLDAVVRGTQQPQPATVAFLVNLLVLADATRS